MRAHWFVLALTTMLLVACGGGGSSGGGDTGTPAEPPPVVLTGPLGDAVTQTIGAAGGTVDATTLGVKVHVSFPAGALAADAAVRITPLVAAAGDWVAVKLEPAGVFFAKPVTVVLEFPPDVVPDVSASLRQRFGDADSYTSTTVDVNARTLSTKLSTFGGAALDVLARPANARAGRPSALSVKALAEPAVPADSQISAQAHTPLADMIASIRRQVTIMENVGDFEAAFALQANIAGLLNRRGDVDFPVTATPFLKEAHDTACLALSAALADANVAQPKTVAEFKPLRDKIGNWWVIADQMDINAVGCPRASIDDFSAAAIDLTRRELVVQRIELGKIKKAPDPAKQRLLEAAAEAAKTARTHKIEVEILRDAAAALDLPPLSAQPGDRAQVKSVRPLAVRDNGYAAIIQTELLDPLVAPAREAAWLMATSTNSLIQYPVLIDAFGSAPTLQQDVQYVRTRVAVTSKDSLGATNASATLGFDSVPELPADPVKDATVRVTPGGRLALSGSVATLECTDQGAETLNVTFENVQVATVSGSGGMLLAGALANLDPADLLAAARLPADDKGTHPLRIRRITPCATALGLGDGPLATVTLDFTPSTRRLLLISMEPSSSGIYTINADGTGRKQLTSSPPYQDNYPAWSPDGKRITFLRVTRDPAVADPANPAANIVVLYVMNADGSGLLPLSTAHDGYQFAPWSPDGTRLLSFFNAFRARESDPYTFDLHVINSDGSGQVKVHDATAQAWAAWSPDGRRIAFLDFADPLLRDGGRLDTYVMNADGSGKTRLTSDGDSQLPTWSPDGTRIQILGHGPNGNFAAYVMNADGSGKVLVAQDTFVLGNTANPWSPDGKQLLVLRFVSGGASVAAFRADGTGQVSASPTPAGFSDVNPSWSPDGSQIAFWRKSNDGSTGETLWVMNADGSSAKLVLSGVSDSSSYAPLWAPR